MELQFVKKIVKLELLVTRSKVKEIDPTLRVRWFELEGWVPTYHV